MSSLNKVTLIGNIGKDPETRFTQAGEPVVSLSVATSESWNDKSGQKQEKTQWHRVSVFGHAAKFARDYAAKGRKVYIEGQINYDEWTDKDGVKKYATKIVVGNFGGKFMLLDKKPTGAPGTKPGDQPAGDDFQASDDDVPF